MRSIIGDVAIDPSILLPLTWSTCVTRLINKKIQMHARGHASTHGASVNVLSSMAMSTSNWLI
jgi:hypothetical protein